MSALAIANELGKSGFCVYTGYLTPQLLQSTRADLERLHLEGSFHQAGIGRAADLQKNLNVRKDEIFWLEREAQNPVQTQLWQHLDSLQKAMNETLLLGLSEFEGHYAAYPAGGFYKRHRDCFQNNNDRMVSLVLYLNEDWKETDGGRLRIYGNESYTDVDPVGGTLVLFMSRDLDHEVLLSHRARYSFTGWFKVRPLNRIS